MAFIKEHLLTDDIPINKDKKKKPIRYNNDIVNENNNLKSNRTNGKSKSSTRSGS